MTEQEIKEKAVAFAYQNKERIAKEIVLDDKYPVDSRPVAVFMAGSPGAGKTESAKALIEELVKEGHAYSIHIDTDLFRSYFEDYTGDNSYLFQGGASIIASRVQDLARKHKKSFIFDSTLSDFKKYIKIRCS